MCVNIFNNAESVVAQIERCLREGGKKKEPGGQLILGVQSSRQVVVDTYPSKSHGRCVVLS